MSVPNVLATRYAGADLARIWSPEHKIVLERQLWIAVLKAQRDLGIDVPDGVVEAYEDVVDKVDLESIAARERITRHDVKARIEEFSALAGHEHIHKGMTSRDLTENVEQLQIKQSLTLLRERTVATPGPAGAARRRARDHGHGRSLAQRRRPGHDARQAVRDRRRRDADRAGAGRGPARPLPAARDQGPDGHRPGHARPARRRRRQGGRARAAGRRPPRLRPGADQRRPGLPALARLRRALRAGAAGRRAVQPRHDDPADGRQRAGHRGLQGGPGRLVRDAAQDEHPLLRTGQRPGRRAPRLPLDGRRARRRPVERGRRLLLGRTPGGAAGRVLRRRRAVPDVPDRARRVRRVPGRDPARAGPLPAVPGHHQGADGRGPQRRRPRGRARGDQGGGGRRRPRHAAGPGRERRLRAARRRLTAGAHRRSSSTRWSPTRSRSPAWPSSRSRRSAARWPRSWSATPTPRRTRPGAIL